jgi:hypothetical protein
VVAARNSASTSISNTASSSVGIVCGAAAVGAEEGVGDAGLDACGGDDDGAGACCGDDGGVCFVTPAGGRAA